MAKSSNQFQTDIDEYLANLKRQEEAAKPPPPPPPLNIKTSELDADLQARIERFEERKERKRDRLEAGAAKARAESSARLGAAHRLGDAIPFGQPILVGHHSEKRHRRDIEKIDRNMRKGFEASDRAADLSSRAAAVGTGGISSDDPVAVQKLRAELAPLEKAQGQMKAANAAIRKHAKAGAPAQIPALVALGYSPRIAEKLLEKDFAGRIGFADYQITNNGANIRRIQKRIEELTKKDATPARASISGEMADGDQVLRFTLSENKDLNRTQIEFSGKPGDAIRGRLKSAGFRWAPTEGAWQRQMSNGAWYHATNVLGVKS